MPEEIQLNLNNPKDAAMYVCAVAHKVPLTMEANSTLRTAQQTLEGYFAEPIKDTSPDEPGDTDNSGS